MCWYIPSYPVTYIKCGHTYWHPENWQMCDTAAAAGVWCDPITPTTVASSTNRKHKCPDCRAKDEEGSGKGKKDRDRGDRDKGKSQRSGHGKHRHEIAVHMHY